MKILSVEAELFDADGQTDMKIIVAFRSFANATKNGYKRARSKGDQFRKMVQIGVFVSRYQRITKTGTRSHKSFTNFTYEWVVRQELGCTLRITMETWNVFHSWMRRL